MSALTTRDALAKAIHEIECGCNDIGSGMAYGLADALLASGVVVDAATLADDDALLTDICHRQGLSEGDGLIWEERGIAVASTFRDLAAVLSERSPR